jgi:hypothetical protein
MNSSVKSALAFLVILVFGQTAPAFAQLAGVEPLDETATQRSKIADIDILTDSPTLQGQASVGILTGQQSTFSSGNASYPIGVQNNPGIQYPAPVQTGGFMQTGPSAQGMQYAATPGQTGIIGAQVMQFTATPAQTGSVAQQPAGKAPIQISSQTVGRVVGVAGTALILGAFLKNGGMGGMMNSFGFDNRFHSRGSSLAPY